MNRKNDIEQIKQALHFLVKAEQVSTDPKVIQGLVPELNTLSNIMKKDLLRRINDEK
ncbi:hypothetical protein [Shewanella baltica]|uniref:hypothetical protein n=1 Tax=Shewanella baltica TaxID=62322 RepID=UPI003D7AD052